MRPSLISYLKQDWSINVSFAIDFTLSNLEATDPRSLHHLSNKEANPYEKAMFEVANVMQSYAKDGVFQAFGFGGTPEYIGAKKVSHCWNLNGEKDPSVEGRDGLLAAYQKAIDGT
jgi:hypothetical protein